MCRGSKFEFAPHQARRFKDGFGISRVKAGGHAKVMTQMMFAVLALTVD
ncbi:hypothetical protein [Pseudomonas borbori]|uniref:Uncharacterized protein n=1 Tax=Pseudomonas borbori TaxID=289003 RepID=A0A1I5NYN4_9PSED|nr:hypothetical protein [Pseudomonas borbori]SFP26361.1 hypothetical protein SAMN05216190_107124 [Pseudomonas borbori]